MEWFEEDVLRISDDARLDTTLFARLGKSHLPPRSPGLLLLKPGMFRRSGIIECVDDRLCEGLVCRGVTNGLCRGGDSRGDGRRRSGYLKSWVGRRRRKIQYEGWVGK